MNLLRPLNGRLFDAVIKKVKFMVKFFNYFWIFLSAGIVLISARFFFIGSEPDLPDLFHSFYINFFKRSLLFSIPGILFLLIMAFLNFKYLNKESEYIKNTFLKGILIILLSSFTGTALFFLAG